MLKTLQAAALLFCMLGISPAFSQVNSPSVIAPAGDVSATANLVLEWTLGEPVVESVSTQQALFTQGFHQPILQVQNLASTNQTAPFKNSVQVYPNPTTSLLNIQLSETSLSKLKVSFVDINGKTVASTSIPAKSSSATINVARFAAGTYILNISDAQGTIQANFKIIKTL